MFGLAFAVIEGPARPAWSYNPRTLEDEGGRMANREHLEILRNGVPVWNEWRRRNPRSHPDFTRTTSFELMASALRNTKTRGAKGQVPKDETEFREEMLEIDLSGADFRKAAFDDAYLTNVKLVGASFQESTLSHARLENSVLNGADLFDAHLRGALLSGADFTDANLTEASLVEADLRNSNLSGANLSGAQMMRTILDNIDLSATKGLDTVRHPGPSTLGVDVIFRSKGLIPDIFLRGVGVPESLIVYKRSLVESPIEFYSCFISYSSKDQEFADRLHADLQNRGVRCWFAPEDLKIGDEIRPRIDEAIRIHDKLLIVLSENSVGSPWVKKEVETAFEKERKQKRTVLFPIRLDDAVMETEEAWAADIRRTRHIGDFRKWKNHDEYQKALGRLMRDLKAEEKGPEA